jgi:hypothetical protein
MQMTYRTMTPDATQLRILRLRVCVNSVYDFLMTFPAGFFGDFEPVFGNAYVVFEPTGGEVVRMPESVARLGHILADELRGRVTIVADGGVAMTGLQPRAVLIIHHVAVRARCGIVRQVRISLGVNKRVGPDTDGKS